MGIKNSHIAGAHWLFALVHIIGFVLLINKRRVKGDKTYQIIFYLLIKNHWEHNLLNPFLPISLISNPTSPLSGSSPKCLAFPIMRSSNVS